MGEGVSQIQSGGSRPYVKWSLSDRLQLFAFEAEASSTSPTSLIHSPQGSDERRICQGG